MKCGSIVRPTIVQPKAASLSSSLNSHKEAPCANRSESCRRAILGFQALVICNKSWLLNSASVFFRSTLAWFGSARTGGWQVVRSQTKRTCHRPLRARLKESPMRSNVARKPWRFAYWENRLMESCGCIRRVAPHRWRRSGPGCRSPPHCGVRRGRANKPRPLSFALRCPSVLKA